jgi:hypothetical protein
MIASFSRALLEGLSDQQNDELFNAQLDASVAQMFEASMKKVTPQLSREPAGHVCQASEPDHCCR